MSKFVFDFGKVNEIPPAGIYNLSVKAAEAVEPKEEGKFVYFKLGIEIVDGEYAGKMIWHNLFFSPKAMYMTQASLEAITHREWRSDNMEIGPEDLLGLRFRAVCTHQEDPGYPVKLVIYSFDTNKSAPASNGSGITTTTNQVQDHVHMPPQREGGFRL